MRFFRYFFFLLGLLSSPCLLAQLNNEAFEKNYRIQSEDQQKLYLALQNRNFLRNNEYFNDIIAGQTFFGYQISPSLIYYPSPELRIELGAFFQQSFGENDFSEIDPIFSVRYQKNDNSITFGNLQANLSHRLIEPLYAFELALSNPLETGLQLKHEGEKWYGDLWVDWQQTVNEDRTRPEIIFGGFVGQVHLIKQNNFRFSIPLQATLRHIGGQNLNVEIPVTNTFNIASGLTLEWDFAAENFIQNLRLENYFLFFQDDISDSLSMDRDGQAFYANLNLQTTWFTFLASLWLGDTFDSVQGGDVYRSFSVSEPGFVQASRALLFFRFLKDIELAPDMTLSLRFEPYYDFSSRLFEYSFGVYLHYQPRFLLKTFKAKN